MALYQPSMIVPDVRNGIGFGVADTTRNWTISWRVNGQSAMTAYQIDFYSNDAASTLIYSTGRLTDGCPFFGTLPDGTMQSFSRIMPAITLLAPGGSYKFTITQWWSAEDSITQNSASVFLARTKPTISIDEIGDAGVIGAQSYTFTGSYSQAQGDLLNWFRWQIADAANLDELLFDSGSISGTMDMQTTFDGFFSGRQYAVRLTAQTHSGADADTGWVLFNVYYGVPSPSDDLTAACADGTNAVIVKWTMGEGTLITPIQLGTLIYNGALQTPNFDNYDPTQLILSGQTSAVNAGTYTAAFTPTSGYDWLVANAGSWSIYRGDQNNRLTHLATVPAEGGQLYDYGAASQQGPYTYYAFPLDEDGNVMDAPIQSNEINPCYQSWSLMECEDNGDGFTVVEEYLFRYNFTSEAIGNNNTPTINENFTRYPSVQKSPQNYRGGALTGLIGTVDREANYSDTLTLRQKLFNLSTTTRALFLKSRKGDLIKIAVAEPVEAKITDDTAEQQQSVTVRWVEIGEAGNVLKLTALDSASGGLDSGSPELVLDPNYVIGNVGDTFTVSAYWRGNGALSANPASGTSVSISQATLTVSKGDSGTEVIPVSVSQTAQYDAQTVPLTVQALAVEYLAVPTQSGTLAYNGSAQSPEWSGYDSAKMTVGGQTDGINAGNYEATFTPLPGYEWVGGGSGARTALWSIGKASPALTVSPASLNIAPNGTATASAIWQGDGVLSASSGAGATASVSGSTVTVSAGDATASITVTVSTAETANYAAGSAEISVTIAESARVNIPTQNGTLTYNGSVQSPAWNNYDTGKMTVSGTTSGTNAGNYTASFTLNAGYFWEDGTAGIKNVLWSIAKASPNLSILPAELTLTLGESKTITATWNGTGVLRASSTSGTVATATVSGGTSVAVSGGAAGRSQISISVSETQNYSGEERYAWVEVSGGGSGSDPIWCVVSNNGQDTLYMYISDGDPGSDSTKILIADPGQTEEFEMPGSGGLVAVCDSGGSLQNGSGSAVAVQSSMNASNVYYKPVSPATQYGVPKTYVIQRGGTFTWQ